MQRWVSSGKTVTFELLVTHDLAVLMNSSLIGCWIMLWQTCQGEWCIFPGLHMTHTSIASIAIHVWMKWQRSCCLQSWAGTFHAANGETNLRQVYPVEKLELVALVFTRTTVTTMHIALLDLIWIREKPFPFNLASHSFMRSCFSNHHWPVRLPTWSLQSSDGCDTTSKAFECRVMQCKGECLYLCFQQ